MTDQVPSLVELYQARRDILDINTFRKSAALTFVDSDGVTKLTLAGITADATTRITSSAVTVETARNQAVAEINDDVTATDASRSNAQASMAEDVAAVESSRISSQSTMLVDVAAVDNSRVIAQTAINEAVTATDASRVSAQTLIAEDVAATDASRVSAQTLIAEDVAATDASRVSAQESIANLVTTATTSINTNTDIVSVATTEATVDIAADVNEVNTAATNAINVDIPAQIARLGLEYPPIAYVSGLTLNSRTKTYSRSGAFYIWGGNLGTVTNGSFTEIGWQQIQGDIQLRNDLGTAAFVDRQITPLDTTPGSLLSVGAFGLGASAYNGAVDANEITTPGFWGTASAVLTNAPPNTNSRATYAFFGNTSYGVQLHWDTNDTANRQMFFRIIRGSVWSPWVEVWNSQNLVKQTSVSDLTAGRMLINGAYGLGSIGLYTADLDTVLTGGIYRMNAETANAWSSKTSGDVALVMSYGTTAVTQIGFSRATGSAFVRSSTNGIFSAWVELPSVKSDAFRELTPSVNNVTTLASRTGSFDNQVINVAEYSLGTDLGGESFVWNSTSNTPANDVTVFGSAPNGRWISQAKIVTAEMAGARPVAGFDNSPAFNRLIAAKLPIVLQGGATYQCNTPLVYTGERISVISSNSTPATIYHAGQANDLLTVSGAVVSTTSLNLSVTIGARRCRLASTAGILPGMILVFKSSKSWYFDPRPESTDARKSEIHVVSHVVGSDVFVVDPFNDGYTLSNETVEITVVKPVVAVVANVIFKAVQPAYAETTSRITGLILEYGTNCYIQNVSSEYCMGTGVSIRHSHNTVVEGGVSLGSNNYFSGYGLQTYGSRNTQILSRTSKECRRSIDVSGANIVSINTTIQGCTAIGGGKNSRGENYGWNPDATTGAYQAGFGSHGSADKTRYVDCITDNLHAHYSLRGGNEEIVNATAYGRSRGGIVQLGFGSGLTIDGLKSLTSINGFKDTTISDGGANINTRRTDDLITFDATYDGVANGKVSINNVYAELSGSGIVFSGEVVQKLSVNNFELSFAPQLSTDLAFAFNAKAEGQKLATGWSLSNVRLGRTSGTGRVSMLNNIELRGANNSMNLGQTFRINIADDAVGSIALPLSLNGNQYGFSLYMTCTSCSCAGMFSIIEGTPTLYASGTLLNIEGVDTLPTGTTGTNGKAAVYLADGKLYIENRLGNTRNFVITVMSSL